MLQIQAKENKCIDLGRRGEDSAREILFNISGWAELYGQGEAQLIAKRDRDLTTYPAKITQDNTTVSWVIKPVDNDQPGYGNCELVYITGGKVVKSNIYQTHTDISLSDPVSPPDSPSTYGDILTKVNTLSKQVDSLGITNLYVCSEGEYIIGGSPTIATPSEETAYLVPQDSEGVHYASWVYANGVWKFVEMLTITYEETEINKDELIKDVIKALPLYNGEVITV